MTPVTRHQLVREPWSKYWPNKCIPLTLPLNFAWAPFTEAKPEDTTLPRDKSQGNKSRTETREARKIELTLSSPQEVVQSTSSMMTRSLNFSHTSDTYTMIPMLARNATTFQMRTQLLLRLRTSPDLSSTLSSAPPLPTLAKICGDQESGFKKVLQDLFTSIYWLAL